jgi:hypothetical protein
MAARAKSLSDILAGATRARGRWRLDPSDRAAAEATRARGLAAAPV